jgi:hypothetical protein
MKRKLPTKSQILKEIRELDKIELLQAHIGATELYLKDDGEEKGV